MKRVFGVFSVVIMLLPLMACAGKQPMITSKVSDEKINQINMELPQRINDNTTLERVSLDEVKSVLVC